MELRHLRYFVATVEAGHGERGCRPSPRHATRPVPPAAPARARLGVALFERPAVGASRLAGQDRHSCRLAGTSSPTGGEPCGWRPPFHAHGRIDRAHHRRTDGHADRRRVAPSRDARVHQAPTVGRAGPADGLSRSRPCCRSGARTWRSGRCAPGRPTRSPQAGRPAGVGPTCPREHRWGGRTSDPARGAARGERTLIGGSRRRSRRARILESAVTEKGGSTYVSMVEAANGTVAQALAAPRPRRGRGSSARSLASTWSRSALPSATMSCASVWSPGGIPAA